MAKYENWTQEELNASVRAYLQMLSFQEQGKSFVKSKINRVLLENELKGRSKGALEYRHQNISYVIARIGKAYLKGYLPAKKVGVNVIDKIVESLEVNGFYTEPQPYTGSSFQGGSHFPDYATEETPSPMVVKEVPSLPLPRGQENPLSKSSKQKRYRRDPKVVAWVLHNAQGICEGCGQEGPFLTPGGFPYLEVHHVVFLSQGGPDTIQNTVALCPNCHARCHYAKDRQSFAEELTVRVLSQRPG